MGIDPALAQRAVAAAQPVFDLRHLRAGNRLEVGRSVLGEFREVRYRIDTDRVLWIAAVPQSGMGGDEFHSENQTIPTGESSRRNTITRAALIAPCCFTILQGIPRITRLKGKR